TTFGARRAAVAATLDAMSDAVLVVGPDGRVLHRNAALERALCVEPQRGRVIEAMLGAARTLAVTRQRHARDALVADGPLAAEHRIVTTLTRYMVRPSRLPGELLGEEGGVLVSLPDASAVSRRFGLTPREVDVATALARRLSNAEIAQALGISPNTALRHTERVLQKLGLRTRLDVASRLQGGAVDPERTEGAG